MPVVKCNNSECLFSDKCATYDKNATGFFVPICLDKKDLWACSKYIQKS